MSEIWFTSDTHFGHSRIIEYCKRPFKDHLEMEEVLIDNFNSRIKKGDILYHLGDVAWSNYALNRFFGRLNTKQVHLVLGNHDTKKTRHENIRTYDDIKSITVAEQTYILCHYAIRSWKNRSHGAIHCYGHSHGTLTGIGRSMDVGVDTNNFFPYNIEDVRKVMTERPIFSEQEREKFGEWCP